MAILDPTDPYKNLYLITEFAPYEGISSVFIASLTEKEVVRLRASIGRGKRDFDIDEIEVIYDYAASRRAMGFKPDKEDIER